MVKDPLDDHPYFTGFNDNDEDESRGHLFSRHKGRHVKKKKLFYKPTNVWGWIDQIIQMLFIIVCGSFLILVLTGVIKGL